MTADFSGFVGIDWSGARGPRQPGIQLAEAGPGTAAPHSIMAEDGRHWGRGPVLDWLIRRAAAADASAAGPVLVGIDFAFAHPFVDEGAFYPGLNGSPPDAAALWAFVERHCLDDPHLYGGAMFAAPAVGDYYLSPKHHFASHYRSRRRATELAARASACAPSPTFKAIGADNVATGSMAGMRLIHALKAALGPRLAVWPFDRVTTRSATTGDGAGGDFLTTISIGSARTRRKRAADPIYVSLAGYDSAGVRPDSCRRPTRMRRMPSSPPPRVVRARPGMGGAAPQAGGCVRASRDGPP